jgi:tetratricopeptide (TPR) repeat protein
LDRADTPTALDRLERAIRLLPAQDETRAEISIDLAIAVVDSGVIPRARDILDDVIDVATSLGNEQIAARAQLEAAYVGIYLTEVKASEALAIADRVIPIFEQSSNDHALARAYQVVAEAHWDSLHELATERTLQKALVHARRSGNKRELGTILSWLTAAWYWGPTRVEVALARCEEVLDLSESDRRVHASVMLNVGGLQGMVMNFDDARFLTRKSREMSLDLGLNAKAAGSTQQAGMVEMMAGDFEAAESLFRTGVDELGAIGELGLKLTNSVLLARALYELDRLDEAEQLLLPFVVEDDFTAKCDWGSAFAKILARRGALEEAEALARDASASAAATDQTRLQADVACDLGEILMMKGDVKGARAVFDHGLSLYGEKGDIATPRIRRDRMAELGL